MMKEPSELRLLPLQVGFICALAAFLISVAISIVNDIGFQIIIQRAVFSIAIAFVIGSIIGFVGLKIYTRVLQQGDIESEEDNSISPQEETPAVQDSLLDTDNPESDTAPY